MANEQLPITAAVVNWARERAGYSLRQAKQTFDKIEDWEDPNSDIRPTYPQLEKLSEAFNVPVAVFFFPSPPDVPPIEETFRSLSSAEFGRFPPRIHKLLGRAKSFQISLSELNDGRNPAPRLITNDLNYDTNVGVDRMTRDVRDYLGVTIADQKAFSNSEQALKAWRDALTAVGIFVFKDAFKVDGYSGFCLTDSEFPIIYVNNSTHENRQIFTLFHELAHLLFDTSGIDTANDEFILQLTGRAHRIEIACNAFAGSFLLPDEEFADAMAGKIANEQSASIIAEAFNVSRAVVFHRFYESGLISVNDYRNAMAAFNTPRRGGGESGGNYYATQISYLGRPYIRRALKSYYQQRISRDELADHLNIKPRNVDAFEAAFEKGGA